MKKNALTIVIIIICVAILVTGGVYAYLTDTDQKTNVFTQGSVKISLTEPNWDPSSAQDLRPGDTISKDPQINNIGKSDAYVYIKVEQPIVGLATGPEEPLFSYTINTGWTLLNTYECVGSSTLTKVYYYNTALVKNTSTTKLFNNVILSNFSQAVASDYKDMVITGYAVQTRNLPNGTTIANAYDTYFDNADCNSRVVYRWSNSLWVLNRNISSLTPGTDYVTDKTQVSTMDLRAENFYLKHDVQNYQVTNSYACFVVTNELVASNPGMTAGEYCLEGGDGGTAYTTNKATLLTAFSNTYCTETSDYFDCDVSNMGAYINVNGYVDTGFDTSACYVGSNGGSRC